MESLSNDIYYQMKEDIETCNSWHFWARSSSSLLPITSPSASRKTESGLTTAVLGPVISSLKESPIKQNKNWKVQRVRKCVCYSNVNKLFQVSLIQRALFVNNNTIEIQILTSSCQERNDDIVSKYSSLHTHSQAMKKMAHTTHIHLIYYDILVCLIQNQYFKYFSTCLYTK